MLTVAQARAQALHAPNDGPTKRPMSQARRITRLVVSHAQLRDRDTVAENRHFRLGLKIHDLVFQQEHPQLRGACCSANRISLSVAEPMLVAPA